MGIKKLSKYIKENNIYYEIKLKDLVYKKIAIDISVLLYQIIISIRNSGDDLRNSKGEVTSHILGLFNKTVWLISNKIIPIFIFDGKPPEFKNDTINYRRDIRKKAKEKLKESITQAERIKYLKRTTHLTKKQIIESKQLLDLMGIQYLQADGEADVLCAKLSENNIVDYVFTEDMDILTFGANRIIKNLFGKGKIEVIEQIKILKNFDLTYKQFIIFCIILGCDYHNIIFKMPLEEALTISRKYKLFDDITYSYKKLNKSLIESIYNYFNNDIKIENISVKVNNPNKDLLDILVKDYSLIKKKIIWKVILLNKNIIHLKKFN